MGSCDRADAVHAADGAGGGIIGKTYELSALLMTVVPMTEPLSSALCARVGTVSGSARRTQFLPARGEIEACDRTRDRSRADTAVDTARPMLAVMEIGHPGRPAQNRCVRECARRSRLPCRQPAGHDDRELFAANLAQRSRHEPSVAGFRRRPDHGVTREMTVGIVDLLEVVDVDHQEGEREVVPPRALLLFGRTWKWRWLGRRCHRTIAAVIAKLSACTRRAAVERECRRHGKSTQRQTSSDVARCQAIGHARRRLRGTP